MSAGQQSISFFPWQGTKATVGTWVRAVATSNLGMGYLYDSPVVQNNSISWDVWLDSGTWKVALIAQGQGNCGIATVQFNGVSQGTVDTYTASTTANVYTEITGISVATAGIKTLTLLMATKNASSADYMGIFQSIALIKTAGAHSTGGGTDTPGYVVQIIPWAGAKATAGGGSWGRFQNSGYLGGGYWYSSGATTTTATSWDIELDAGTYKYAQVHQTANGNGIASVQLAAVTKGTIDSYSGVTTNNVYSEITGIVPTAGVSTFQLLSATQNASSLGFNLSIHSCSFVRTGA